MESKGYTAKEIAEIFNVAQRKVEATRRIIKYSEQFPDIKERFNREEITIHQADRMIRERLSGRETPKYVKIPLDDPNKAAELFFSALYRDRTSPEFIKSLGYRLLGIEQD